MLNYTVETGEEDSGYDNENSTSLVVHRAHIHLHTPWEGFSLLDTKALLEIEDNVYRTNLTLFTSQTWFTIAANAEVSFLNVNLFLTSLTKEFLFTPLMLTPPKKLIDKPISNY